MLETQSRAAIVVITAIGEAIRDLGSVPSGHLYAQVCDRLSLQIYEQIIDTLVGTGLVRRDSSHLLTWIG